MRAVSLSRAAAGAQSQWRISTDAIKWTASIVHILAYLATAMDATPLNMYLFFISVISVWKYNASYA